MDNVVDIFRNVRDSPEYKASLVKEREDLEMRKWELEQEARAIQTRLEIIDEELA